ncbi:MAG TPA: hypothetical protein VFB08_14360 [Burkholderiales bacterium]|nr:hypothetical protein [Burkholderiales bacterium]
MDTNIATRKPNVLIAGTPDTIDTVREVFGDALDLRVAHTLYGALDALDKETELILCNVRFDESRMFDFLYAVRARPNSAAIPIVCFRAPDKSLSEAMHGAIDSALRTFDNATFVDMHEIARKSGAAAAMDGLRVAVVSRLDGRLTDSGTPRRLSSN